MPLDDIHKSCFNLLEESYPRRSEQSPQGPTTFWLGIFNWHGERKMDISSETSTRSTSKLPPTEAHTGADSWGPAISHRAAGAGQEPPGTAPSLTASPPAHPPGCVGLVWTLNFAGAVQLPWGWLFNTVLVPLQMNHYFCFSYILLGFINKIHGRCHDLLIKSTVFSVVQWKQYGFSQFLFLIVCCFSLQFEKPWFSISALLLYFMRLVLCSVN